MGLLTGLLTLPLAPLRMTVWVAEQLLEEVERELADPARVEQELDEAQAMYDRGEITDDELAVIEDELLRRLTAGGGIDV